MSLGGVVAAAKRGHANMFTPAVHPAVSLPADSSPYTGEPGADLPAEKFAFPPACESRLPGSNGESGGVSSCGKAKIPARLVCTDRGCIR